jgi:SpoVK/Ycf46/Vps4 family AAA+-type ATPase
MTRIVPEYNKDPRSGYVNNLEHLLDEIRRLDSLIHLRLLRKQNCRQTGPLDQFKGLVLLEEEIIQLITDGVDEPADDSLDIPDNSKAQAVAQALSELESRIEHRRAASLLNETDLFLARLSQLFNLTRFEEECLLICLAPEIDRKYEKLYAYLQDDVTQKKPSVDLLLGLLCETKEEKLAARSAFDPQAALLRYRLLQVIDCSPDRASPLISRSLKLDDRVAGFLLGSGQIDSRLQRAARLISPRSEMEPTRVIDEAGSRISEFIVSHSNLTKKAARKIILYFSGPYGTGKLSLAKRVCRDLRVPLIACDVSKLLAAEIPFEEMVWLLGREAALEHAALCLENFDHLLADDDKYLSELRSLVEAIRAFSALTFLLGRRPWKPQGLLNEDTFIHLDFPTPDEKTRKQFWETTLTGNFHVTGDIDQEALAGRFKLTPGKILDAVRAAETSARWRSPSDVQVTIADLYAACRAQANPKLDDLARKIDPKFKWDDLVLPPDQLAQLAEVCNQTRHLHTVYGEWGFDRKLSLGKGLTALFTGSPGTGKTMAAEVIAGELNLDLYKIDLSQVVSKYIGETEKNLRRIFDEAQSSSAILFFDEADALFGKRSEVKDAHDRYANIEVGYLLQKMEEYDGIAILATNLRQNMDEAFTRRIRFIIEFPFPDEQYRRLIWQVTFPPEAPLAADVDLTRLAREVRLAGGNIKNIALAAAFFAAGEGGVIAMSHLVQAARREFQKIGRRWSEEQPPAQEGERS